MTTFEWIIGLLLGAVALAGLARRLGIPYPTFLAVGGAFLAFAPGAPQWTLEPDLALALFVAPVLLDAAFDTSLRDLRENWLPVAALVFFAVGTTTAAVAIIARWLVPDLPWSAAIALGAIVAPPDAAAAVAILRQVNLPYRLQKILEGESLLNDASALLIYRVAVGAAMTHTLQVSAYAPRIGVAVAGSLLVGFLFAKLWPYLTSRIADAPSAIIVQFATTFTVWIVAERLGLSGILTIVAYATTLARSTPAQTPARLRVPSYAVWDTMVFMLNVLAFVLIGMQLSPIWHRLADGQRFNYCVFAAAVLATVIIARIAWVMFYNTALRLKARWLGFEVRQRIGAPSIKNGIVVAWCGMRGIVTLAAAFALPDTFPYRDLILLSAFAVVLGTLLIQGLTLKALIKSLRFPSDDPVGREAAQARTVAFRAAIAAIDGDPRPEAELLRAEYRTLLSRARADPDGQASGELPADPLRRRAIDAARQALFKLRADDVIGDDAFHRLEEELDWAELGAHAARVT